MYMSHSSFNSFKNGKHLLNEEESINYKNNKGKYRHSKFGKIINNKEFDKTELNQYLNRNNLYLSNTIYEDAFNIINNIGVPNNKKTLDAPIHKGLINKKQIKKITTIDNKKPIGKSSKECNIIGSKYRLPQDNSKNAFKKIYKKRVKAIHPNKCKTKKCKEQFKELNEDYTNYFNKENNC